MRAGVARARRGRLRGRRPGRDGRGAAARCAAHSPTSRSSTSACRRRTRTRVSGRERRSAGGPGRRRARALALRRAELRARPDRGRRRRLGYLLKDRVADLDDFAAAIRRVAEGGSALDPAVVTQLVGRRRATTRSTTLTPREREVLALMAEGARTSRSPQKLVVTERAVEKHVTSIFGKLHLPATPEDHRRILAVLVFLR